MQGIEKNMSKYMNKNNVDRLILRKNKTYRQNEKKRIFFSWTMDNYKRKMDNHFISNWIKID